MLVEIAGNQHEPSFHVVVRSGSDILLLLLLLVVVVVVVVVAVTIWVLRSGSFPGLW